MSRFEESIRVAVPVRRAYDQWTQFEEFPTFMDGVKSVRQLDDRRLSWEAEVAGRDKSWEAEIVEQTPDQRVAWRSISGARNAGSVRFTALGPQETEVILQLEAEPDGAIESIGDALPAAAPGPRGSPALQGAGRARWCRSGLARGDPRG